MNTITLHMENRADNTAVSNYFIDTLMPQANGEFVKIYLYLLRCVSAGHISLSVSEMSDLFNQIRDNSDPAHSCRKIFQTRPSQNGRCPR